MMKVKSTGSVVATLFLSSAALLTTIAAQASPRVMAFKGTRPVAQNQSTTFRCIRSGRGFATIAQRGDRTTPALITWNTTLGNQYHPQQRCNAVSQRLTKAVAYNGGKLKNLELKAGPIKNQVVVCVVKNVQSACNTSNMLFTLRPENARKADQIVARLNNFSVQGSGAPVAESSGIDAVSLEDLNRFLGSENIE